MKKKTTAIITSLLLAGSMLLPSGLIAAQTPSYNSNPSVQDIGPKLRAETVDEAQAAGKVDLSGAESAGTATANGTSTAGVTSVDVGIQKKWITHDDRTGRYKLTPFTLRAVGKYGEVWVANDLQFPNGDPRNSMVSITGEQVNYLLSEFDNRMYEKEVSFFAPPKERKGYHGALGDYYADDNGRVVILVDNIKDASYDNPNYPSYIAGYFSPTISDLADRNVMTIDAFDWANRTGSNAARPYLYEGTFAHEFQHLLHRDTDAAEENFINEGLSDFAQFIVGYGHSNSHVNFFMNNLKNSLTLWGDQSDLQILGDYGNAYLFELYLYDQYGEKFIQDLFKDQKQGIDSVNDVLTQNGLPLDFKQLYANYLTALVVDGKYRGSNQFAFNSIDLTPNLAAASKQDPVAPAWGTDFKTIVPDKKIDHLYFKGIDFLGTKWANATDPVKGAVVWGNTGDQADNHLIKELDLTGLTNAALTFDTKYDIEEQWDFGVVQVSTDGGKTWTSLANENTRSDIVPAGYPAIKANLPGFTGSSNGWVTESFDLSAYAGQKVLLDFRYMTDWGYTEAGWYLSNLQLNGTVIDLMTSTAGFMSLEQAIKEFVNYQVQFVGFKKGLANGAESHVKVVQIPNLVNMSEADRVEIGNLVHSAEYEKVVMMVTYAAPVGKAGNVSYDYDVVMKSNQKK